MHIRLEHYWGWDDLMFQYVVVILCIAAALFFIGRRFYKSSTGQGCGGCKCAGKSSEQRLIHIEGLNEKPDTDN